jgi:hypothetical protein
MQEVFYPNLPSAVSGLMTALVWEAAGKESRTMLPALIGQPPEGAEAKMRAATAFGATAILILAAEAWACAAGAEDAIKPGKWEFWTVGSKISEPPPGTQLPPSVRWGPEGMITSVCISETTLKTPHYHVRTSMPRHGDLLPALKTKLGKGSCDFDVTTDATAATRSWSMNCAWSSGNKSNTEGVVHFHGDTLDGMTTSRYSSTNYPTKEYSYPVKGRYVGPCDPK